MAKAPVEQALAPAPEASPVDQDNMPLEELARAVLGRTLRPRASAVRRLAEGLLAHTAAGTPKKAKKDKSAAASDKSDKKKGGGKKRKLAKIPGTKG